MTTAADETGDGRASVGPMIAQLRILFPGGRRLGPGKIDLLEAIARSGSISAAGRELKMSYRRAWLLVEAVNDLFGTPSVVASTGGLRGGGAVVTDFGQRLIAAYRRIEARTQAVVEDEFASLTSADRRAPPP